MTNELELLRLYADTGSEEAFRQLVRRRVDFVYATALRVTNDPHLADEVTQTVFTDLARKAKSLRNHPLLSGWLHRSARYAAINAFHRKLRHEEQQLRAESMNEINSPETSQRDWREIRPLIDGLLNKLNERDRTAVILRFFEGSSFSDIGTHLHLSEDAARMCVSRALDRLHDLLARRGMSSTTAALAIALESQSAIAAPAGLAAAVSVAALSAPMGTAFNSGATLILMANKTNIILAVIGLAAIGTSYYQMRISHLQRDMLATLRGELVSNGIELRDRTELITRLRGEVAELKSKLAKPTAALPAAPSSTAPISPTSTPRVISGFRNVGRSTPVDAAETFLWSQKTGDYTVAAELIRFKGDEATKMKEIFDSLSEPARQLFRTPEFMYSAVIAGMTAGRALPDEIEVLDETTTGPDSVDIHYKIPGKGARSNSLQLIDSQWTVMMNMPLQSDMLPKWKEMAQTFADDALKRQAAATK